MSRHVITAFLISSMMTGVALTRQKADPRTDGGAEIRRKIPQGDDAKADAAFCAFRSELQKVVREHDQKTLFERFLAPGIAENLRHDGLRNFWREMGDILRLGAARSGRNQFEAPYFLSKLPDDVSNGWHGSYFLVIIAADVAVHEEASSGSRVLEKRSYDIVRKQKFNSEVTAPDNNGYVWRGIITASGQPGYVYSRFARDPCDKRALFMLDAARKWVLFDLYSPCE